MVIYQHLYIFYILLLRWVFEDNIKYVQMFQIVYYMRKNITQFNTDILDQSTDRKAETAQQHIEASERQAIVRDAVVALPQNQRELILLRDYHGFKYTEIDEILNVPIGTIMSRLSRVRKQLRLRLFDLEEI